MGQLCGLTATGGLAPIATSKKFNENEYPKTWGLVLEWPPGVAALSFCVQKLRVSVPVKRRQKYIDWNEIPQPGIPIMPLRIIFKSRIISFRYHKAITLSRNTHPNKLDRAPFLRRRCCKSRQVDARENHLHKELHFAGVMWCVVHVPTMRQSASRRTLDKAT